MMTVTYPCKGGREGLEALNPDGSVTDATYHEYDHIGVRFTDHEAAVGEELPHSYVWDDGEWTDETLSGASALEVRRGENVPKKVTDNHSTPGHAAGYEGKHAYLIGAPDSNYGEDDGEIVMRHPKVIAILDRFGCAGPAPVRQICELGEMMLGEITGAHVVAVLPDGRRFAVETAQMVPTISHPRGMLLLNLSDCTHWSDPAEGCAAEWRDDPAT
jgi:hypothetical protein